MKNGLQIPSFEIMKNLGFKNVKIKLNFQMMEDNDGYQGVMIYLNDRTREDDNYLALQEFDHGLDKTETEYASYLCSWTFSINSFLPELDIDNDGFCIRFGARGWFSDTWRNRNMKVTLEFNK